MANAQRSKSAHTTSLLLVLSLALPLLLAGCHDVPAPGDGDGEGNGGGAMTATSEVRFDEVGALGPILVDGDGRVLYVFTNDEPGTSNCYDQCAVNWPPFIVEEVPSAPAVIAGDLSLVERTDGETVLAYDGLPLYGFVGDDGPGVANGDGRGGVWFVVRLPPTNSEMLNDAGPNEVERTNATYQPGVTGTFARPAGMQASTGVVMIHEWWGLNDNIRDMADLLATHGYAVLAVDLFNGSLATTAEDAQAQVQALDQDAANDNMRAAAAYLRNEGVERVVALGWCFGGGQSLQLSLTGEDLAATIIYYGFLETNASALEEIEAPVLGIFGEDDQAISVETVRAFETALDSLDVENQILIYPEVGHAFANPSGDAWAPEQTADAWARTLALLARVS